MKRIIQNKILQKSRLFSTGLKSLKFNTVNGFKRENYYGVIREYYIIRPLDELSYECLLTSQLYCAYIPGLRPGCCGQVILLPHLIRPRYSLNVWQMCA